MKSSFLNVLKKLDINSSELFIALVLITLPLPRILNSLAIGLLLIFALISFFNSNKMKVRWTAIITFSVLFFSYCLFTLLWSYDIENSLKSISRISSYLIIPIVFLVLQDYEIRPAKIIYPFVFTVSAVAIIMLVFSVRKYANNQDIEVLFYHDLSNQFDDFNAIYFSVYVSFSILFLLSKRKSTLEKIMLIFLIQFLILLSSKTVIFVTLLSSLLFIRKRTFRAYKMIFITSLLLIIVTSFFFRKRIQFEIQNSNITEILTNNEFGWQYKWSGLGIRTLQARVFYELMEEDRNWLLGYGLRAAENRIIEKHKELRLYSGMIGIDIHNQYLQFILELGLIGFCLHLLLFCFLFRLAWNKKDKLFGTFLFLVTTICFTEIYLSRQRGMVFFLLLSFVYFNYHSNQKKLEVS